MYAVTILVSAIHVHLIPAGTVTATETGIATETETATEMTTDAAKDVREFRALLANAAAPTDSDSKELSSVLHILEDKQKPRIKAGLHTKLMYYNHCNQYLFFFPILFLYLFLRWLKIVSLRGLAFLIIFFTSLTSPKTISTASTSKMSAATTSFIFHIPSKSINSLSFKKSFIVLPFFPSINNCHWISG